MKKLLLIAALMAVAMSASAQWFDFSNNKGHFDLGFHLGQVGIGCPYTSLGFGASLNVYGVYVDFISAGPEYKYDNHIETGPEAKVPDATTMTASIGYQIPVLSWLRIMPLIGFSRTTKGYTDFSTINAETTSGENYVDVQLYHDYITEHSWNSFNFGGGLVIQPVKWVSIYGVYTTHSIYGGISVSFGSFNWKEMDD